MSQLMVQPMGISTLPTTPLMHLMAAGPVTFVSPMVTIPTVMIGAGTASAGCRSSEGATMSFARPFRHRAQCFRDVHGLAAGRAAAGRRKSRRSTTRAACSARRAPPTRSSFSPISAAARSGVVGAPMRRRDFGTARRGCRASRRRDLGARAGGGKSPRRARNRQCGRSKPRHDLARARRRLVGRQHVRARVRSRCAAPASACAKAANAAIMLAACSGDPLAIAPGSSPAPRRAFVSPKAARRA